MKNISFNRIGLLLKRYFLENWKVDVIMASIIFAIETFSSLQAERSAISFSIILVFLIIFSGQIFSILGKPQGAMNYLMLPASTGEKLATNIILTHFYYPILLIAVSCLGILASSFVCALIYQDGLTLKHIFLFQMFDNSAKVIWLTILFTFLCNAVTTFGSIFFRRKAAIKTILCVFAFMFILFILSMIIVLSVISSESVLLMFVNYIKDSSTAILVFSSVVMILLVAFFWILSYLRLRETEA